MLCSFGRNESFFDENFTIAALAFLASRLLAMTHEVRQRRARLRMLAEDCRTVVRTRERVVGAARTIQRAWRKHWQWKLSRWEKADNVDIWLV
jgi:hypothetical protein